MSVILDGKKIIPSKNLTGLSDELITLESDFNAHAGNSSIHTPALTANKTIYVSPSGSDESGDGSKEKPYKTLSGVTNNLPKNLGNQIVNVNFAKGDYIISALQRFNNGTILFTKQSEEKPKFKLNQLLNIVNNSAKIIFANINFDGNNNSLYVNNSKVKFEMCDLENFDQMLCTDMSDLYMYEGMLKNNKQIWATMLNSTSTIDNVIDGGGNINGLNANGSVIFTDNLFGLPYIEINGGRVFSSQNANQSGTWTPKLQTLVDGIKTDVASTFANAYWQKIGNRYFVGVQIEITDLSQISHGIYIANFPAQSKYITYSSNVFVSFLKTQHANSSLSLNIIQNNSSGYLVVTNNTYTGIHISSETINLDANSKIINIKIDYEAV